MVALKEITAFPAAEVIRYWYSFYEKWLLPDIARVAPQPMKGFHGLATHSSMTVFRGIDYALVLNQNPAPVVFACALHDAARISDLADAEHGRNAVPLARAMMNRFPKILTSIQKESVLYAIAYHSAVQNPPDYISSCLWDADRTRLSWKNGYKAHFFATERARKIASAPNSFGYLEYQAGCLGKSHSFILSMFSQEMGDETGLKDISGEPLRCVRRCDPSFQRDYV